MGLRDGQSSSVHIASVTSQVSSGECHDTAQQQKLRNAVEKRLLPKSTAVRQALRDAFSSASPEIFVMGSAVMNGLEQAMSFRQRTLEYTVKVCAYLHYLLLLS